MNGALQPSITTSTLMDLFKQLPIMCDDSCFFITQNQNFMNSNVIPKVTLYFDVYYEFNLLVTGDELRSSINLLPFAIANNAILNISDFDYFSTEQDAATKYLIEGITHVRSRQFLDGIPKLVTWLDKYDKPDSSGFCDIRNSCIHPNLFSSSRPKLEKKYPGKLEFETDDSLKRDSQKNMEFLESLIPLLFKEIKPHFLKRFFDEKPFLHNLK